MEATDQGRTRLAVLIALAVVVAGLVTASGFVFADDQRSGEDILEDVQEQYETADSVSADTVVTVEAEENTTQFNASVAAAGDEQLRLNVSDGDHYLLTGTDGESLWVHDPETELTGVLTKHDDGNATLSLRAGTREPTGIGLSDLLPDEFDENTTVGEILAEVDDDEIPAEWREELESLPQDATLAEITSGEEFEGQFENATAEDVELPDDIDESDIPDDIEESDLPDDWEDIEEWNESAIAEAFDESDHLDDIDESDLEKLEEVELPEDWENKTLAEKWDAVELPEEWEDSEWAREVDAFTDEYSTVEEFENEFNTSDPDLNVTLVGTTTVDGQEANELLITHPDLEGETRLWTGVESDVILKQETTTPDATIIIDVVRTQFDVSPAADTFEPPGTTELGSAQFTWTEEVGEFAQDVSIPVAVPDDAWSFEYGGSVETEMRFVPDPQVDTDSLTVGAKYDDGEQSLVVAQSDRTYNVSEYAETEMIRGEEVALNVTETGAVATWTEEETTITVAGELSKSELRAVIKMIEFEQ